MVAVSEGEKQLIRVEIRRRLEHPDDSIREDPAPRVKGGKTVKILDLHVVLPSGPYNGSVLFDLVPAGDGVEIENITLD